MLFVENKTLRHRLNTRNRIQLLKELRERDRVAVIRSSRLKAFELLLSDPARDAEMESELVGFGEHKDEESYIKGEIFSASDHVFFLNFDDTSENPLLKAGIVYHSQTSEPFRKLDAFCSEVRDLLIAQDYDSSADRPTSVEEWQHGSASMPGGFKSFIAKQDTDSLFTSLRHKKMGDRVRAAAILEDTSARVFLRRAKEAHVEGYAAKLLTGETLAPYEASIERLTEAGLVEKEVQVSCRKTGHALFRLPNAHALAVVTVSDATCSECGSPVADERVEEVIAPTLLASSLLEDGSWLISRLYQVLRELGVPESEIAVGPSEGDGYGQMMANVCGESFLILARDGDLTPSFARWAIDLEIETEASHLVVIATGRVHNHAGALLQNHSRHRVRAGNDFELVIADDAATASTELRFAFERVAQRVLAEQLCDFDSVMGLSVSRLIMAKFKLEHTAETNRTTNEADAAFRKPLSLAASAAATPDVLPPENFAAESVGVPSDIETNGPGNQIQNAYSAEN
jgi:hypothetical protein